MNKGKGPTPARGGNKPPTRPAAKSKFDPLVAHGTSAIKKKAEQKTQMQQQSSRTNNVNMTPRSSKNQTNQDGGASVQDWNPALMQADNYASLLKRKAELKTDLVEIEAEISYLDDHPPDMYELKKSHQAPDKGSKGSGKSSSSQKPYSPSKYSDHEGVDPLKEELENIRNIVAAIHNLVEKQRSEAQDSDSKRNLDKKEHELALTIQEVKDLKARNQELSSEQKRPGSAQVQKTDVYIKVKTALDNKTDEYKRLFTEFERLQKEYEEMSELMKKGEKKIKEQDKVIYNLNQSNDKLKNKQGEKADNTQLKSRDLEKRLKEVEKENAELQNKLRKLSDSNENLMKNKQGDKADGTSQLKHTKELQKKNEDLEKQLRKVEKEKADLDAQIMKMNDRKDKLSLKNEENEKEIEKLQTDLRDRESRLRSEAAAHSTEVERNLLRSFEEEKEKMKMRHEKEIRALKDRLAEAENSHTTTSQKNPKDVHAEKYENKLWQLEQELKKEKQRSEQLQTRFSHTVSQNLRKDNPNITDLSDENRPQKLAEKYTLLYDTEWTDLQEKWLGKCQNEKEIISTLYFILEKCYYYCIKISEEHLSNVYKSVITLMDDGKKKKEVVNFDSSNFFDVKEMRKRPELVKKLGDQVKQNFKTDSAYKEINDYLKKKKFNASQAEAYFMKCVHLCWLMIVQVPSIVIDFSTKNGDEFDKQVFREYTSRGDCIDYVVWPPIFLHEDGPLLQKGVAQGY